MLLSGRIILPNRRAKARARRRFETRAENPLTAPAVWCTIRPFQVNPSQEGGGTFLRKCASIDLTGSQEDKREHGKDRLQTSGRRFCAGGYRGLCSSQPARRAPQHGP